MNPRGPKLRSHRERITRVLLILAIIAVCILNVLVYILYEGTKFTVVPKAIKAGESFIITYHTISRSAYDPLSCSQPIDSIKNSNDQEVYINLYDGPFGKNEYSITEVKRIVDGPGILLKNLYDGFQEAQNMSWDTVYTGIPCRLGGPDDFTLSNLFKKIVSAGTYAELYVLPGTPAGEYTMIIGSAKLRFTVTK